MLSVFQAWDLDLYRRMERFQGRFIYLYYPLWGLSALGYGSFLWGGLAVVIAYSQDDWSVVWVLIVLEMVGYLLVSFLVKWWVGRPRPTPDYLDDKPVFRNFPSYSFPSGHTSSSVIGAVVIGSFRPLWWPWLFLLVLAMAFSRLYLLKHYFFDVVVGGVFGLAIGAGGVVLLLELGWV